MASPESSSCWSMLQTIRSCDTHTSSFRPWQPAALPTQQDPVLACTAEVKSLVSAVSKHIIMFVTRLTALLCVKAGWQVQASTERCSCSLQRGPVLWCQLCCQRGRSQPEASAMYWLRARWYSTERSAPQLRWWASCTERHCSSHSQICQFKTTMAQVTFKTPLLRADRLGTPSLSVSSRPTTFHRDEEPVAPHKQWR